MNALSPAPPVAPGKASPPNPRSRRRVFRLLAMFLALLPFLALELALVILDVANPSLADDPLSGFSQSGRLFELDQRDEVYRTATARGLFFGDQEFAAEKPEDGFRVFCLGGSTVRGRPFTTESSFTRWLDLELADRSEGRTIEAVNCGGLSYASYRLRPIVAEVLRYRPDLIVVATGHNEFLEDRSYRGLKDRNAAVAWLEDRAMSLRTVTWCRRWLQSDEPEKQSEGPEEVQARLDEQRGFASYFRDAAWQDEVVSQYVESLKAMIAACRRAEVPLVLVRLGSNLRDCPPFKSEHRDGIAPAELSTWQAAMDAGVAATDERRFDQALTAFREAEEIDDQFALVAWRIARTLDRLGRPEEAATAYRRARDLDVCPLRMITRLDKSLQRVASQSGTPLVDAAGAIEADSDDGLPGSDWYVDHVHPTLRGHQRIAELLVEEIGRGGWLELSAAATAARVRLNRRRHFRRLGPVFFSNGARRVEWLENWARRQRLDAEVQPVSWIEFARAGNRAMDFGQWEDAWKAYAQALAACPEVAPAAVTVLRHACWLFEQGRSGDAADLVDRLRELPEAEQGAVAPIWSRAALVLDVESGDREQAERTLARYSRLIKATASSPDTTGWGRVMPDVLDRARRLTGSDP
ncbi:MAG: hypothetical protein CMJ69_11600 [Planctomycetaceae bacterium]|nr:hypothetical protein [Planctomycetaceae bacterium]